MPASPASRSLGVKLLLVGVLAVLMGVPALMVFGLVWDRSSRADSVMNEVAYDAGGVQVVHGPMLIVPVREPHFVPAVVASGQTVGVPTPVTEAARPAGSVPGRIEWQRRAIVIFPDMLRIDADMAVELRRRSIFEVPVYTTALDIDFAFDRLELPPLVEGSEVLWSEARIAVAFGDVRGIRENITLTYGEDEAGAMFEPGLGDDVAGQPFAAAVSVPTEGRIAPGRAANLNMRVSLGGGRSLRFAAVGRQTDVSLTSNWPHPSFQGQFLTTENEVREDGFEARWSVPYLARSLRQSMWSEGLGYGALSSTEMGVDLVLPGSPYQRVGRALKYAVMFVGFVFFGFFLFEAASSKRVHAAQYVLVGAAQVVFYLLLLAFAEQFDFNSSYAGAAGATVLLTALYASFTFGLLRGFAALLIFAAIYGLLYVLMMQEDYALLIGSVTAFLAIALMMILTRNVDWYGGEAAAGEGKGTRDGWSS